MTRGQPQTRRRALVTGGAIRLGRAIALGLADAGFDVAIAYHRSGAAARTTVRDLRRRGVRAEGRARDTNASARRRVAASRDRRELRRAGTGAQATRSCAGALARNHARPSDAPR